VDLPALTTFAKEVLRRYCTHPMHRHTTLGLSTLRDLIIQRPALRAYALRTLLGYTSSQDGQLRDPAIRLVTNLLFPRGGALTKEIERSAAHNIDAVRDAEATLLAALPELELPAPLTAEQLKYIETDVKLLATFAVLRKKAAAAHDKADRDRRIRALKGQSTEADATFDPLAVPSGLSADDKRMEIKSLARQNKVKLFELEQAKHRMRQAARRDKITSHLMLFFALCAKKQALLPRIFHVYWICVAKKNAFVCECMRDAVTDLVRALGSACEPLLQAMENAPPECTDLLVHILFVLTEEKTASVRLVQLAQRLMQQLHDARLLVPVISGLKQRAARQLLPELLQLDMSYVKLTVKAILYGKPTPFKPADFMVALHALSSGTTDSKVERSRLKSAARSINLCFAEHQDVFPQNVLAVVLQQMVQQTPVPRLFMFTLIQTLAACPRMLPLGMTFCQTLISEKRVWTDSVLWKGFLKCAATYQPHSYPVLLSLPLAQFTDVVSKNAALKRGLRAFVQQSQHVRVQKVIRKALGL
jgi:hypothetical protein